MEKDPRARSGGLWSKRSNGFSAASVRGLYETQAHEETGGRGRFVRSESMEEGDRRNVNSNCQILKLPAS